MLVIGNASPPVVVPPSITLAQLQGFWNGASLGGASVARAVVLSDGAAWLFLHDAQDNLVGLSTSKLVISYQNFSGRGARYPVSGAKAETVIVSGGATGAPTFPASVTSSSGASSLALTADTRYTTPASKADTTGNWRSSKAGGTIIATWTIDANGPLSGTSPLGCTCNGSVPPHGTVAVYDVTITETCTGSITSLSGIAKLNTAKTFLPFGMTTADGAVYEPVVAENFKPLAQASINTGCPTRFFIAGCAPPRAGPAGGKPQSARSSIGRIGPPLPTTFGLSVQASRHRKHRVPARRQRFHRQRRGRPGAR